MIPCNIWIERCEAAPAIEEESGTRKALEYLVGHKLLNFLAAAEDDCSFSPKSRPSQGKSKLFELWIIVGTRVIQRTHISR
jgi:hypothetical protein